MGYWTGIKKLWRYIWYDDSLGSLALNVILAFIIIRYVVYPLLGLFLGTGFPIVAVVSGSMEHDGNFNDWWESECCQGSCAKQMETYSNYNITKEEFLKFRFKDGFNKGDIMLLVGAGGSEVGDTLVFLSSRRAEPIIHRVIKHDDATNIYSTKGDHNCAVSDFETVIKEDQMLGKAVLRIPFLGYIKIIFVEFLKLLGIGAGI